MKTKLTIFIVLFAIFSLSSCNQKEKTSDMNIIFLHHSTGGVIWKGDNSSFLVKVFGKISGRLANFVSPAPQLPSLLEEYNKEHGTNYLINEHAFPKASPYGWNNYPFDYYNIWVKNTGEAAYMEEPTLEMLTKDHQLIIFKHCFPVSNIQADKDSSDISSDYQSIANYKLQYSALKEKLQSFPDTKFILFTGAVQVKSKLTEEEAKRANEFFKWVREEWDVPGDNIHLWDLYSLQTEGGLYFKDEYAVSPNDSHPNMDFADRVVKLLFSRIIDVIENNGNGTRLTGEKS